MGEANKFKDRFRIPSARAEWHDYNDGVYFVTICTHHRKHHFGEIVTGHGGQKMMILTEIGKHANKCIPKIESIHPEITIPVWVVMPDHIHLVIIVGKRMNDGKNGGDPLDGGRMGGGGIGDDGGIVETPYYDVSTATESHNTTAIKPSQTTLTGTTTSTTTKNGTMQKIANHCGRLSHVISRFKTAVTRFATQHDIPFAWQARFHDHIIRDPRELARITQYIERNVENWGKSKQ